ncbi:MAG: isochorismate synthase [Halomonas sp.]|nr:isochorismate synthase [Halomonas sp.]MDN6336053.1 isochorismate synthase [Halomonas sp.]
MTTSTALCPARAPMLTVASTECFVLRTPQRALNVSGCRARLPSGATDTLGQRVREFFAAEREGPGLLVGALPFDPHAPDALFQPERQVSERHSTPAAPPVLTGPATAEPAPATYADMVERCVAQLSADWLADRPPDKGVLEKRGLEKAVLARSLNLQAEAPIDPLALAARLERDPSVTTYVAPLPVGDAEAPAWLVGATPELLISRRGRTVTSHPLAGSIRRRADPETDRQAAASLQASAKDLAEHRYVVDAIVAALGPLCSELDAPTTPELTATESMWHLGTRIVGTLKDDASLNGIPSAAELAGLLHPTPAVCGTPREPALAAIKSLEPVERGFYAGAVGWVDTHGDGDWYVAIRCARVQGASLRLFAGAGIVAGSLPALEVEETAAKFTALLDALGVDRAPGSQSTRDDS